MLGAFLCLEHLCQYPWMGSDGIYTWMYLSPKYRMYYKGVYVWNIYASTHGWVVMVFIHGCIYPRSTGCTTRGLMSGTFMPVPMDG